MTDERSRTVRVRISGRVQGVFYRAWTCVEAERLGLDGWVRNRPDGTVEAVFSGRPAAVEEMVGRCRRGPPAARVERVEVAAEASPPAPGFHQRPTG